MYVIKLFINSSRECLLTLYLVCNGYENNFVLLSSKNVELQTQMYVIHVHVAILMCALVSSQDVIVKCGRDEARPFVWNCLKELDLSSNSITSLRGALVQLHVHVRIHIICFNSLLCCFFSNICPPLTELVSVVIESVNLQRSMTQARHPHQTVYIKVLLMV